MQIALLLQRYKDLGLGSSKRIREIILQTLRESFSMELADNAVEVKDKKVKISISGAARTHFTLLRPEIEKTLRENLSKEGFSVHDIF